MNTSRFVTNLPTALKPTKGAGHLTATTISSTAVASSAIGTLHADTEVVTFQVATDSVRMTVNGTTPTSAVGLLLYPGQLWSLSRSEWLAAKFIESGWSVKALHRLIVNSTVYQIGRAHV